MAWTFLLFVWRNGRQSRSPIGASCATKSDCAVAAHRHYSHCEATDCTTTSRRWLALRRPQPLHQGSKAALRLQFPRHQAGAEIRLRRTEAWQIHPRHGIRSRKSRPEGRVTTTLYVNGQSMAQGDMRTQSGKFTLSGDGLCVGYDSGDAVSEEYKSPGTFKGGTILGVGVDVSPEVYLDLEKEASRAMSRD